VEAVRARPVTALQIHYAEAGGITGHVMLLCMLLMYTTAHAPIRKQSFEAFWYTHHLAFIFLLAFYTHATGCFVRDSYGPYSPLGGELFWNHCIGYEGWRLTLWSGGLYFFERVWRVINSRRDTTITKVVMHPQGKLRLQPPPDYRCNGDPIP
jgi:NADPH oxidase 1